MPPPRDQRLARRINSVEMGPPGRNPVYELGLVGDDRPGRLR
jgi:hypothetical protein